MVHPAFVMPSYYHFCVDRLPIPCVNAPTLVAFRSALLSVVADGAAAKAAPEASHAGQQGTPLLSDDAAPGHPRGTRRFSSKLAEFLQYEVVAEEWRDFV